METREFKVWPMSLNASPDVLKGTLKVEEMPAELVRNRDCQYARQGTFGYYTIRTRDASVMAIVEIMNIIRRCGFVIKSETLVSA